MSIEDNLFKAVSRVAGGKIWPGRLPQQVTESLVTPAVVFWIVAGASDAITQTSFVRNPRYRFDIWGSNVEEIVTTASEIIAAIDHRPGLGFSALFLGELDDNDPETGYFHRILEFSIWEQT